MTRARSIAAVDFFAGRSVHREMTTRQPCPVIRTAPAYTPAVVTANLDELELVTQYLLAVVERVKDMPLAEQRSHLVATCGVAADRVKYAIKQIKESK